MAATKLKVEYKDGTEALVIATARAQIETERHFRAQGLAQINRIEAGFYLAWASLHFTGQEPADFEAWVDRVNEAEVVDPDEADELRTDPTPTAQSTTGSSD